jgi:hypothetical protein
MKSGSQGILHKLGLLLPISRLIFVVGCTVLYSQAFLYLLMLGMLSPMMNNSGSMSMISFSTVVFLFFLAPSSIPFSVFYIWVKYWKAEYKKMILYFLLPIFIYVLLFFLSFYVEKLGFFFG